MYYPIQLLISLKCMQSDEHNLRNRQTQNEKENSLHYASTTKS